MLDLQAVAMEIPADCNIILGQSHFIKTVEDIYEAVVNSVPQAKFGVAFNEASGPSLIRTDGNDDELRSAAVRNAQAIGAGHAFVVLVRNAYPVNLIHALRRTPEVVNLFCASANPVQVVVAVSEQGRGIMGVIDGNSPKGVEGPDDVEHRHEFLRKIGYKR